jgi:hypothetical protein
MLCRKPKETLRQVKERLTREQARRTETRIRQLLPPPQAEEDSGEGSDEETVVNIAQDRRQRQGKRRRVEAPKGGLCARILWFVCVVVVFGVCVVFCSVLLLICLSKATIVLQ